MLDIRFGVIGDGVPLDHGYPLFAAMSRIVPEIHEAAWLKIRPLEGLRMGDRLHFRQGRSTLQLRLPAERIPQVLSLAGKRLQINETALWVGSPSVHALRPTGSVDARLVVFNVKDPPKRNCPHTGREQTDYTKLRDDYLRIAQRQLAEHGVTGTVELCGFRQMVVLNRRWPGFSMRVSALTPEDSLTLQAVGLGGKQHMGCSFFVPTKKARA